MKVIQQIVQTVELLEESKVLNQDLVNFWKSIYHYKAASGGPFVTGWCNSLIPYIFNNQSKKYEINPCIDMTKKFKYFGVMPNDYMCSYAKAPMRWEYFRVTIHCDMIGGIVGTQQREEDGAVAPIVGWIVKEKKQP